MRGTQHEPLIYCATCADPILTGWRGWPHRDPIPTLPLMQSGRCESCGGDQPLPAHQITWLNCHGSFSTGLPDYWVLQTNGSGCNWGHPYLADTYCRKCGGRAVISEMRYSGGTRALRQDCLNCGVLRLDERQWPSDTYQQDPDET
jgi:hypothetical protein